VIDPVTTEVVGNYLVSAVREMGTTLMRTAYSTIIRESMDCTTALFDPMGQLIAQADHVPSRTRARSATRPSTSLPPCRSTPATL
jgi:N-methylhydantoinase B